MSVESDLRVFGTRLDDVQHPISLDEVLRAHATSRPERLEPGQEITTDGGSRLDVADHDGNREMEVVMLSPDRKRDSRHRTWMGLAAAAVLLVVVAVLAVAVRSDDDSSLDSPPASEPTSLEPSIEPGSSPAEVVEAYRVAYNAGDIDGLMALFTEESTLIDHPLAATEMVGLELIRRVHLSDIGKAAGSDAYEFSNVEVSGDTVTWDHTWTDSNDATYCAEGHRAVVTDGKIVTWTFGTDVRRCE